MVEVIVRRESVRDRCGGGEQDVSRDFVNHNGLIRFRFVLAADLKTQRPCQSRAVVRAKRRFSWSFVVAPMRVAWRAGEVACGAVRKGRTTGDGPARWCTPKFFVRKNAEVARSVRFQTRPLFDILGRLCTKTGHASDLDAIACRRLRTCFGSSAETSFV